MLPAMSSVTSFGFVFSKNTQFIHFGENRSFLVAAHEIVPYYKSLAIHLKFSIFIENNKSDFLQCVGHVTNDPCLLLLFQSSQESDCIHLEYIA